MILWLIDLIEVEILADQKDITSEVQTFKRSNPWLFIMVNEASFFA